MRRGQDTAHRQCTHKSQPPNDDILCHNGLCFAPAPLRGHASSQIPSSSVQECSQLPGQPMLLKPLGSTTQFCKVVSSSYSIRLRWHGLSCRPRNLLKQSRSWLCTAVLCSCHAPAPLTQSQRTETPACGLYRRDVFGDSCQTLLIKFLARAV